MSVDDTKVVAEVIGLAGNKIVGRTRFQKIAYLLKEAGFNLGFRFAYKHYGPYSEDLAKAAQDAVRSQLITEKRYNAQWGGKYSIFEAVNAAPSSLHVHSTLEELAKMAAVSNPIELEIAATALYLHRCGHAEPWSETQRRKPEKATKDRLESSRRLYGGLALLDTPNRLPTID